MLSILAVILVALSRSSWIWPLAPIGAICGYALIWKSAARAPFLKSLTLFFCANLIHLCWMLSHPYLYIVAVWIALSLFLALPYALLSKYIITRPISTAASLLYASLLTLCEWLFTLIPPCGFSFQNAALHLSWSTFALQTASVIGAAGLSFIVFWTNILFFARRYRLAAAVALFPYLIGAALYLPRASQQTEYMRVALVHTEEPPDIYQEPTDPYKLHEKKWSSLLKSIEHIQKDEVDCIIFPEGSVPFPAQYPLSQVQSLPEHYRPVYSAPLSSLEIARRVATHLNTPIIFGSEARVGGSSYNSCFFVPPSNQTIHRYDKQLLLPFGEYIPFDSLRSYLKEHYGLCGSFLPGKGPRLFDKNHLRLAPFICYEETFPSYAQQALLLRPKCLISHSNDAWFPHSRLAREHLETGRLRAVEIGKPLVRSCNMGVSTAIDALGRTIATSTSCEIIEVNLYSPYCLYATLGHTTVIFLIGLVGLAAMLVEWRRSQNLSEAPHE